MSSTPFSRRYPLNVPGKFYIDDQCTDCDLCRECAPKNIRRDDRRGQSYVYRQPENEEEEALIMEGVEGCPTEAVRDDGDRFDWDREAIMDWNAVAERWTRGKEVVFDLSSPVISCEQTLREERLAAKAAQAAARMPWWRRLFRL